MEAAEGLPMPQSPAPAADAGSYEAAMARLAELKAKPQDELDDAEKREKLRLANRESARKMRRKQATQLEAGQVEVDKMADEVSQGLQELRNTFETYVAVKRENAAMNAELASLHAAAAGEAPPAAGTPAGQPHDARAANGVGGPGAEAPEQASGAGARTGTEAVAAVHGGETSAAQADAPQQQAASAEAGDETDDGANPGHGPPPPR